MFEDSKIYGCFKDHLPAHCTALISNMASPEQNPENPTPNFTKKQPSIKIDGSGRRWHDIHPIITIYTEKAFQEISFIPDVPVHVDYSKGKPLGQIPHTTKLQRGSHRQPYFRLDKE